MSDVDVAVIGAGVIGAAVAERLTRRGFSALVLDRRARVGGETTERNSGVIHAGLYYSPESLKTVLCVEGNRRLYAWAADHHVAHRKIGKLVVATTEPEEAALHKMLAHGLAVGAQELEILSRAELEDREPAVRGRCALWSGTTGTIDPVELTASLIAVAEGAGATMLTNAGVTRIETLARGYRLTTERGPLNAARVVNAAGLHADDVAALAGVGRYRIHPCRGDYFRLRRGAFRHLIYPVKVQGSPGLGAHLTISPSGELKLGPDATWIERKDDYGPPPIDKRPQFAEAARRLFEVEEDDLVYDSCGIRPKLRAPTEDQERDFVIAQDLPGFVNLVGIESPGLTAALAIAERVSELL
jgi:L-2-hydroxyglutarate oxidase LhgO